MKHFLLTLKVTADEAAHVLSRHDSGAFVSMTPADTNPTVVTAIAGAPSTVLDVIGAYFKQNPGRPIHKNELAPVLKKAGYKTTTGTAIYNFMSKRPGLLSKTDVGTYQYDGE